MNTTSFQKGDLLILDTETTHLDPDLGDVISLAAVRVNRQTLEEVASGVWYCHPRASAVIDPEAIQVNGYSKEKWNQKPLTRQAAMMEGFLAIAEGAVLFGKNVTFDTLFLHALLKRLKASWPERVRRMFLKVFRAFGKDLGDPDRWEYKSRNHLDLTGMGLPLIWMTRTDKRLRMGDLAEAYGVQILNAHDALADVRTELAILRAMKKLASRTSAVPCSHCKALTFQDIGSGQTLEACHHPACIRETATQVLLFPGQGDRS